MEEIDTQIEHLKSKLIKLETDYKNYHDNKYDLREQIEKLEDLKIIHEGGLQLHERRCLEGTLNKLFDMIKVAGEYNYQIELDHIAKTEDHQYSYVELDTELSGDVLTLKIRVHATSFHAVKIIRSMLNKQLNMEEHWKWGSLN